MPTQEQMEVVSEQIRDVIGRNYIESDGDQASCWFQPEGGGLVGSALFQGAPIGSPEPFSDLPSKAKGELLVTCIDWEGFTVEQRREVSQRVIDGETPKTWMDNVQITVEARQANVLGQTIKEVGEEERQGRHENLMAERREYHRPFEGFPDGEIHPEEHPVRPLTEQLINAVLLDAWPGRAAIVDFGIDSESHLGALQFAIKHGEVTPQELDAAMCCGAKLTEIAQRGNNPYRDVVFHTSWDKMFLEPPEQPETGDIKALFAEIRADEHAARVRDYGADEAATYEQRARDGAGSVQHLDPSPTPLSAAVLEEAVLEIEKSWHPKAAEPDARIEFEKILHGEHKPEVKQERGSKDIDGREM